MLFCVVYLFFESTGPSVMGMTVEKFLQQTTIPGKQIISRLWSDSVLQANHFLLGAINKRGACNTKDKLQCRGINSKFICHIFELGIKNRLPKCRFKALLALAAKINHGLFPVFIGDDFPRKG